MNLYATNKLYATTRQTSFTQQQDKQAIRNNKTNKLYATTRLTSYTQQQNKQAIRNNKTNKNCECKYYINSIHYTVK